MTTSQTPADPSACKVGVARHTSGEIAVITIFFPPGRAMGATEYWGEEEVSRLIALARDEERGEPGAMPSDRALILAALRDLGIPIQGEEEDDDDGGAASEARIQHAMAFGLEPPEEAPHRDPQDEDATAHSDDDDGIDWREVPVLVQVDGAEDRLVLAGAFADANAEEPGLAPTLRELIRGDVDWCRFGGGAAPMVQVVRAIENPDFDADVSNVLKHTIAKAEAADALLDAAKALLREWDSPDLNDASPIAEKFAALRAAIAKAEGRAS